MKNDLTNTASKSKLLLPRAKHDHIQGSIDAPIALVEYGDYVSLRAKPARELRVKITHL